MYTTYSSGFDAACEALETIADLPAFPTFCPAKVMIESSLIAPIQRIPRYSLLIEVLEAVAIQLTNLGSMEEHANYTPR